MKLRSYLFAVATGLAALVVAQGAGHSMHSAQKPNAVKGSGMAMMDMKKCMADMAQSQSKMDALVAKMNAAEGTDKTDATVAVVTEMVNQQKMAHKMCSMMMTKMGSMPKAKAMKSSAMPMMDMKKCMGDMAAGQMRMDDLVAKMNHAQDADKPDATSAVVNEMASQQKLMHQMCKMMMNGMGSKAMMNAPKAKSSGKMMPPK